MRIRTVAALSAGTALGASAMYLLDPEHGRHRRRDARRQAVGQARQGALRAALDTRRRLEDVAWAAVDGYRQARQEPDVPRR